MSRSLLSATSATLPYPHNDTHPESQERTRMQALTPPRTPLYLSAIGCFTLYQMLYNSGRVDMADWTKHSGTLCKAFSSSPNMTLPDAVPTEEVGKRMVERFQQRVYEPTAAIWKFMHKFKKPHSLLKHVHGPSKLRLEITAESWNVDSGAQMGADFRPLRSELFVRVCDALKDKWLYQRTQNGNERICVRVYRDDLRKKKIPKWNKAKTWEKLFGKYTPEKPLLSDEEKALERRGCWWDGRLVNVVDDEIFPGWGEEWDGGEEYGEDLGFCAEDASPLTSAGIDGGDTVINITAVPRRVTRLREDGDDEEGTETASAAKKPRKARGWTRIAYTHLHIFYRSRLSYTHVHTLYTTYHSICDFLSTVDPRGATTLRRRVGPLDVAASAAAMLNTIT